MNALVAVKVMSAVKAIVAKENKMSKVKNHIIYNSDPEELKRLASEYVMIGRDVDLDLRNGQLTILALPRQKQPKTKQYKRR